MTNIWTQVFEDIRKPHFEMEDPYTAIEEKKNYSPSRDQDGYGDNDFADNMVARMVASGKMTKAQAIAKTRNKSYNKEEYVDEAQEARNNPEKYEREQSKKYATVRGERTPMPPRGNKKREDFEKWYRANVKEEIENIIEVDKTKENERKLDVRPGIKNKVVIGPQIKEEVEEWVSELVEEGYDLSELTWDEMTEIYESAELNEGSSDIGPAGDAQTVAVDTQSKKLARARIQKDMADVKYNRAVSTSESYDSIVEYLSQRNDAFENLEEGVYDPKKTKLRPASERTKKTVTPAQRAAAKKDAARTAEIHSKGETVLAGLRSSGTRGRVQTTPTEKPAAPQANRTVKGRYDKLAKAANSVLKDLQNK